MPEGLRWWLEFGAAVDAVSVEVSRGFDAAGLPHRLLKGPSIAGWLYGLDEVRPYGDSDFLVRHADWDRAGEVLAALGFAPRWDELAHRGLGLLTSYPWERGDDAVDLHATLEGLDADPHVVWDVLSREPAALRVLDTDVPVLGLPARTLHLALHAAQHHRNEPRPREDLRRAVEQLPEELWRAALDLAERVHGTAALAFGLRLVPGGPALAARIGVPDVSTVQTRLRDRNVPLAEGLNELVDTATLRGKLGVAFGEAFPRPAFMRLKHPVARRRPLGLAAAYVARLLHLLVRLPAAVRAVRASRRSR